MKVMCQAMKLKTNYYVVYQNNSYRMTQSKVEVTGANEWCQLAKDLKVKFQGVEDGLPTDHYLWLTGQGRKMLRGEVPLKSSWPAR